MVKTKYINKDSYLGYQKKAYHVFGTMNFVLDNKLWTAAWKEAVFVCINMLDALLVKKKFKYRWIKKWNIYGNNKF